MRTTSAQRRRTLLHVSLAALFAAVSLLGQGLHLLPGLGHGPGCHVRVAPCSGTPHGCGAGHGCAAHGSAGHACDHGADHAARLRAPTHVANDCGACPICNFFATGKVVSTTAAAPCLAQAVSTVPAGTEVEAPQRPSIPLGPRGPPQA